MIPTPLLPRLSSCSLAELAVLWRAFADLLEGIEMGRATYGSEPGSDDRDYIAEARNELRDGVLYLAMDAVRRASALASMDVAEASALNVRCPACGTLVGRWCGTSGNAVVYCQERIAANRARLEQIAKTKRAPDWPSASDFEGEAP